MAGGSPGYRHVVVGTDGSATASEAVRHAAGLAAAFDAKLTVVTAFHPDPEHAERVKAGVPEDLAWSVTDSAIATERAAAGRKLAREAGATDVDVYVEAGDPADVVISTAELRGADVIVVGSKGMTTPSRFLVGSVPNKISHHAPCDVIIVHTAP
jgi:nucleotide-binding universal stress UspA family protein